MATANTWRTRLNDKSFVKKIRENNVKESVRKSKTEVKGLVAVNDHDLFIWDNCLCHFTYFNLHNLTDDSEKQNRFQVIFYTC